MESNDSVISDKAGLFARLGLPEEDVKLDGVGVVRIRALSRYEILLGTKGAQQDDVLAIEQAMVSMAMVEPKMSKADVEQWQKLSPMGQLQQVTSRINALSGVGTAATNDALKSFRGES